MDDAALLNRWHKLMALVEGPYAEAVEQEKNRFIVEVSTTFPSQHRILESQGDYHTASMLEIARRFQGRAIWLAVKEALGGVAKSAGVMERKNDWEKLWLYLVMAWVQRFGAQRARESANTTRKDIQRIIDAAFSPGIEFDPIRVATALLRARQLSRARAEVIARTEVHAAMMFASQEGAARLAQDAGVQVKKRWVPVTDERTRVNHAAMGSVEPIALDADFTVGGERMARPGDPRGSAGNVIGCRCVLAFSE